MKKALFCSMFLSLFLLAACTRENPEPIYTPSDDDLPLTRQQLSVRSEGGMDFALYTDHTAILLGISGENMPSTLTVPETYESYVVIGIADDALRETSFSDIALPDTLQFIGERAFQRSAITRIRIPDSVIQVGKDAFDNCLLLEKVVFGQSLSEISTGMFYSCRSLREVILPESVLSIGDEAFADCRSLERVSLPEGLGQIGNAAFWNSGTPDLVFSIPQSVEAIGADAFAGSAWLDAQQQEWVLVGNGVLLLYRGSALSVTLPESVRYLSNAFDSSPTTTLTLPDTVKGMCENAFSNSSVSVFHYNTENPVLKELLP